MDSHKIDIHIVKDVSSEFINDIISTAFEGGINYWCDEAVASDEKSKKICEDNNIFLSDIITQGGIIDLFYEDKSQKVTLTLEKILNGIKIAIENNSCEIDIFDDYDADDADCIVQYAVFGELVYS